MRILFLGDVVGRPGREAVSGEARRLREELALDVVLANAENASGGLGLKPQEARRLLESGLDALTSGNHIWKYREIQEFLNKTPRLLRPANYSPGAPGSGLGIYSADNGAQYAVINLQGRTYMEPLDCPFRAADELLAQVPQGLRVILVDFHAEATSEKIAMAHHLSGRVTAVLGTHTHVQTSDARVLRDAYGRSHTAAMTDLGMCGPEDSILGMEPGPILYRLKTGLPARFKVAGGAVLLEGGLLEVDEATGRALSIEAFRRRIV